MNMTNEQMHWMMKVFQPEKTVASLPGGASLDDATYAHLLGLDPEYYSAERARLVGGARTAARELLADPGIASMVDHLPLRAGARVFAFGDSRTSDPQSWAVILDEMFRARRPCDDISVVASAISGDTTTHGLIRVGEMLACAPDWVLFFLGLNDARMQGRDPTKTIVHHDESARNFAELRGQITRETEARLLWITPVAVDESRVANHWALSRFGVNFRNDDVARIGRAMHAFGDPVVDLFSQFDPPALDELLIEDGLHFSQAGQKRVALEILRGWSSVA